MMPSAKQRRPGQPARKSGDTSNTKPFTPAPKTSVDQMKPERPAHDGFQEDGNAPDMAK
jgi:hypothetical protein